MKILSYLIQLGFVACVVYSLRSAFNLTWDIPGWGLSILASLLAWGFMDLVKALGRGE